ncbi:hypothetical protein RJT34_14000 [Clitoria ternatea]|uniref:Uncharacterized protein n=1 Tax=Clitoria ternatea TaxID=43366 RepID=A0AAN9JT13_CLITE
MYRKRRNSHHLPEAIVLLIVDATYSPSTYSNLKSAPAPTFSFAPPTYSIQHPPLLNLVPVMTISLLLFEPPNFDYVTHATFSIFSLTSAVTQSHPTPLSESPPIVEQQTF